MALDIAQAATTPAAATAVVRAGRARPGNHNNLSMLHRDQRHPAAKFDDASVRRIRRRRSQGVSAREIANALGCHYDTIRRIVSRLSYGGVT